MPVKRPTNLSWERQKQRIVKKFIKEWLKSFNTDSATCCFTAVQELKKKMGDKYD